MNYGILTIKELIELITNNKIKVEKLIEEVFKNIEKHKQDNFYVNLDKENAINYAKKLDELNNFSDKLTGIPFFEKDNIATKNLKTTSSSKILGDFIPPYSATVHEDLIKAGAILMGKTTMDELGMGGTGLFASTGIVANPRDKKRIIGGSSSGSTYAVATGIVPFATGSDTGDSIRKPASLNGIVGFKPTYGAISRFGLFPYAPSFDTIGFLAKSVEDVALLSDIAIHTDEKDFTSTQIDNKDFEKNLILKNDSIKFGFLKNVFEQMPLFLKNEYDSFFEKLKKEGHTIEMIDFHHQLLETLPSVYKMISFAEAVSTNSNLDGINFGKRVDGSDYIEIMKNSRTNGFGPIVKKRFVLGSFQLKRENQVELLLKSKQVRRMIIDELAKIYNEIDILILPPTTAIAPLIDDVLKDNVDENDVETGFVEDILILANINGMPSITLPFIKEKNMPIGINLNAAPKNDLFLLQVAKYVETFLNLPIEIVGE
ncbi:amidase family protein [Spiroplasma endosymbiont of Labia minor]|uniref:amidase family protein n=1 Tax=Spiroplasma endosymbiont of Labia minor TaxID=3066305 RepID=UPI0030D29020